MATDSIFTSSLRTFANIRPACGELDEVDTPPHPRSWAPQIDALPQLEGGCINYWEAGNWALNDAADPPGAKTAQEHRQVHMHLLGRSRFAKSRDWQWGEAPRFPAYAERLEWAAKHERLTAAECAAVVGRAREILRDKFAIE